MANLLANILEYISQDPLRVLYFIGGGGGIVYWWDRYRNRPRIRVRILNEDYDSVGMNVLDITTTFEVENLGSLTSLEPKVLFSGYTPKREKRTIVRTVQETNRSLPTHTPKVFTLHVRETVEYPFLLLRTYVFRVSRGKGKNIRVWSESGKQIGRMHFLYELLMFRLFGKFDDPGRMA